MAEPPPAAAEPRGHGPPGLNVDVRAVEAAGASGCLADWPNVDANALAQVQAGRLVLVDLEPNEETLVSDRVFPLLNGVFRGQAVRHHHGRDDGTRQDSDDDDGEENEDVTDWRPHGFGVWTRAADARRIAGHWRDEPSSDQFRCIGRRQDPGLTFEGEWLQHADDLDCNLRVGVGVALVASETTAAGCWLDNSPQGLGQLTDVFSGQQQLGWLAGLACVRPCVSELDHRHADVVRAARRQFPDQPSRGLAVLTLRLDRWRTATLGNAITRWQRLVCEQSVAIAVSRRLDALGAWQEAQLAETRAMREQLEELREEKRRERPDVFALMTKQREAEAARERTRQRCTDRRREAEQQLELARMCAVAQRQAVEMLESELNDTTELLDEARRAQGECQQAAHELQVVKRQIEAVTIRINATRQQIHGRGLRQHQSLHRLGSQHDQLVSAPATPLFSIENAPSRPSTGINRVASDMAEILTVDDEQVCDIPGCKCGIPRDVFMRVGATLNGE